MTRTQVLTDEQWARNEPLLPSSNGKQSRPFRDHRQVLEGVHLENGLFCQVTHLHRIVTEAEFRLMSELAGLEVVETFGD